MRAMIAFVFIAFVLIKPIRSFVLEFSKDKIEMASADTEENESEENESEEQDSEEDSEEEKFQKPNQHYLKEITAISNRNRKINFDRNYSSEFMLGVALPPPELG